MQPDHLRFLTQADLTQPGILKDAIDAAEQAQANAAASAQAAQDAANLVDAPAGNAIDAYLGGNASGLTTRLHPDKGEQFITRLDQKQPAATIIILGDSTGTAPHGEWPRKITASLATKYPTAKAQLRTYNSSNSTYSAPEILDDGTTVGVVAQDTFTRTSADLIGSTSSGGTVWTSGTTGKYTVDGTKAAFVNGATGVTAQRLPATIAGRLKTSVALTCIHDGGAHTGFYRILSSYVDASNFAWIEANLKATPSIAFKVSTTAGGTVTVATLTGADCGLTTSLSPQTFPMSIEHTTDGKLVFTFNTGTYTHMLTAQEDAAFASASQGGFWGTVNDHSWDNITINGSQPPTTTLDVYNGSVGSTKADYPLTRIGAMIPTQPDAVIINYSHNHTTETPATFETALDNLVVAIRNTYPGTPILVSGQNPQYPPTANPAQHNARQADLRRYARERGFGYVPVFEAFQSKPDVRNWVKSDGVHPTDSGTTNGSQLWADTVRAYLDRLSLKPGP